MLLFILIVVAALVLLVVLAPKFESIGNFAQKIANRIIGGK